MTHAGLLTGLNCSGCRSRCWVPVCAATPNYNTLGVFEHCQKLAEMLGRPGAVEADDVWVDDSALAPGYGRASRQVRADMRLWQPAKGC